MKQGIWSSSAATLVLPAVALVGFVTGRCWQGTAGIFPGQIAFLAGAILGLAGILLNSSPDGPAWSERFVATCIITYVVIPAVVEPLAFVGDAAGVLVPLAWLLPLILGAVLLPSRGCWRAG